MISSDKPMVGIGCDIGKAKVFALIECDDDETLRLIDHGLKRAVRDAAVDLAKKALANIDLNEQFENPVAMIIQAGCPPPERSRF